MSGLIPGRLDRIGDYLNERFLRKGKIAMWQALVARHGEVVWRGEEGLADIERAKPVEPDTIFRIYSMTKPITSAALLMLFEEGRFRLDDPLGAYLPHWQDPPVWVSGNGDEMQTEPAKRPISIRDVLRHTAGLTYGNALASRGIPASGHPVDQAHREAGIHLRPDQKMSEYIQRLCQVPLRYQPGEGWSYSMASDVCGALIETLSGQRLDVYFRERVFEPLGMHDTAFHVPADKVGRFAANYTRNAERKLSLIEDPTDSPYLPEPTFCSGGGGLVGTTDDYLRFCEMLRNGGEYGGERLLAPRTVRLMLSNHLPGGRDIESLSRGILVEQGNAGVGYGLGIATTFDPVATGTLADSDAYWSGVASTLFWIDRQAGLSVIFMTQLTPPYFYDFRGPLRSLVYSSLAD